MSEFLDRAIIEKGVCGHTAILELIRTVSSRRNFAHAFLFYGPRNVGKLTCAKLLTISVNCAAPKDGIACFECENCLKILRGRFEFFTALNYKFGEIPIDDIRNRIISPCMLKVPETVKSVYIINDARYFNAESANCFLKTLEEPTANVIFILITSSFDAVLPTIRSRCQPVRFDEVPPAAVKAYAGALAGAPAGECLDIIIETAGSIGAVVAAITAPGAAADHEALSACIAKLKGSFTAADAGALIKRVYDPGYFSRLERTDFCSENVLQLDELFDKIERVCLSKHYLRSVIVYSLLFLAARSSRRDYQALCHELSHCVELFFQAAESFAVDYVAGFKSIIAPAPLRELTEKAKREMARARRDEFLTLVSLALISLEKLYAHKALGGSITTAAPALGGTLERLISSAAERFTPERLERIIEAMINGHHRDIAANISVELYLERYLMSVIEK